MYIAIDIGATKTLIAAFSLRGRLLDSVRFLTDANETRFFDTLEQEIRNRFDLTQLRAIAIALPGPVQNSQPVFFGNLPWQPSDIQALLSDAFHVPIAVENDARASALAEGHRFYRGRTLFITLSTGIGVGIISRGVLDPDFTTYEPGHAGFTWDNRLQEWEDIASAQAVSSHYDSFVDQITDPTAWSTDIPARIAIGLVPVIETVRPTRIIFGGPLGEMLPSYAAPLRRLVTSALPADVKLPRFLSTKYQAESVLYGGYLLAHAAAR
jgi:predicted NBD/HSP70 family sugar kinase